MLPDVTRTTACRAREASLASLATDGCAGGMLAPRSLGWLSLVWLLLGFALGCGAESVQQPRGVVDDGAKPGVRLIAPGDRPQFRFRALDGREVSSDVVLGRNSVVAFLATFDWASQAQARFVSGIALHHKPRTNCFAVIIELPENEALVESYVQTLGLKYPVAQVTSEMLGATSLGVTTVPTVLVFDTGGNVVWRSRGLATEDEIQEVLRAVE